MAFSRRETAILLIGDFLLLGASLWITLLLRNLAVPRPGYFEGNLIPFIPIFLISLIIFYVAGLYEKQTSAKRRTMSERILGAQTANVIIAAIFFFVLPLSIAPKTILVIYLVVSVLAISFWRFYRMRNELAEEVRVPAVLVGSGPAVSEVYEEVRSNGAYVMRFSEHIDTAKLPPGALAKELAAAIDRGARMVVLDTRDSQVAVELPQLYAAMVAGVSFLEFSAVYEDIFDRVPLAHVDYAWLLECLPREHSLYDTLKILFDLVLTLIVGTVALPFVLIAALLVRISGGPAFIRNERVGKNGRIIRIYKLRTMLYDDKGDPELRAKNRITALGRFLRKTRIDELPQLYNVLTGDLSFIGPRPELPAIALTYEQEIPFYHLRHLIPPGLSGWAQIHDFDAPKGGADIERTRRKLSYDLYYLKHRSFGLDLAIALKTLRALLAFSGK